MPKSIAFINPSLTTRNVGDLFIEDAVKRILVFDRAASVDVDPRTPVTPEDIARINRTDAAVIVGTDLWFRDISRKRGGWRFTLEDLRKIRVPVIPFGVGTCRLRGEDNGFEPRTAAQLRWIHDSCAAAGTRDARSLEALQELGIRNVRMTACPTLFHSLRPEWKLRIPADTWRVVVTVRKAQRPNVKMLLKRLRKVGMEPLVAVQQAKDLRCARRLPVVGRRTPTLFQFDVRPHLELTETTYGAIGWRLHGNMLQLAYGKPAVFFACCSRAESFAQGFDLPYVYGQDRTELGKWQIHWAVERLVDPASFAWMPDHYARCRAEMIRFLEANGLEHHLGSGPAAEGTKSAA